MQGKMHKLDVIFSFSRAKAFIFNKVLQKLVHCKTQVITWSSIK